MSGLGDEGAREKEKKEEEEGAAGGVVRGIVGGRTGVSTAL